MTNSQHQQASEVSVEYAIPMMSLFLHPLSLHMVESISIQAMSMFVQWSSLLGQQVKPADWHVAVLAITMMWVSRWQRFQMTLLLMVWHKCHAWVDFCCFLPVECPALLVSIFCPDFVAKLNMHSLVSRSIFEQAVIIIKKTQFWYIKTSESDFA